MKQTNSSSSVSIKACHIASKWNRWASCRFSLSSAFFSCQCNMPIIARMKTQTPIKAIAVSSTMLLGVRYSLALQLRGTLWGYGMTISWEFGMIAVHSCLLMDFSPKGRGMPTYKWSRKLALRPRPSTLYGNWRAKCADWLSCPAEMKVENKEISFLKKNPFYTSTFQGQL